MNQKKAQNNRSDFIPPTFISTSTNSNPLTFLPLLRSEMEPAKIDWKTIDSVFVVDSLYEHINAPKWVDFSSPPDPNDINQDEAWFCRPDCKHPKTAEDFYKLSPPSKLLSMVGVSDMLKLRDRNKREANLKRRQPVVNGCENSDPNVSISTPPPFSQSKSVKEALKSSADHKEPKMVMDSVEETRKLKSTRSAKNLLGRDIFNHFAEFCNELKKLAIRAKDKEDEESVKQQDSAAGAVVDVVDDDRMDVDEVAKTPLLGISKEKFRSGGGLRRKKRFDEAENTPVAIDLNCLRNEESQKLLKIRTNPPTPQCFSTTRGGGQSTGNPMKDKIVSKPKYTKERSILQVVKHKDSPEKMELSERSKTGRNVSPAISEKEGKPLDMFWFLKPCTLSEAS